MPHNAGLAKHDLWRCSHLHKRYLLTVCPVSLVYLPDAQTASLLYPLCALSTLTYEMKEQVQSYLSSRVTWRRLLRDLLATARRHTGVKCAPKMRSRRARGARGAPVLWL